MKALNERRRRAVELLTLGKLSTKQTARAVGVAPSTLAHWVRDPVFRRELEAWRAGPPLDAPTVAQCRRIIADELSRRVLKQRTKVDLRILLGIYDRLSKEPTPLQEESHDDDVEPVQSDRPAPLTDEEAERIWAEREARRGTAEGEAPAQPEES